LSNECGVSHSTFIEDNENLEVSKDRKLNESQLDSLENDKKTVELAKDKDTKH